MISAAGDGGGPDHGGHAPARRGVLGLGVGDRREDRELGRPAQIGGRGRANRDGLDRLGIPRGAGGPTGSAGWAAGGFTGSGRNGSMKSVAGIWGSKRTGAIGASKPFSGRRSVPWVWPDSKPWPRTGGWIGCSSSVAVARIACVVTGIVLDPRLVTSVWGKTIAMTAVRLPEPGAARIVAVSGVIACDDEVSDEDVELVVERVPSPALAVGLRSPSVRMRRSRSRTAVRR